MQNLSGFKVILIQWYKRNARDLPWRHTADPFKIWLSEIIMQQTRVAQGTPYYYSFTEEFKTVGDLADAPVEKVLRLWQGLGYYSRARNMHNAAKQVVNDFNGNFPEDFNDLLKLKGVGRYTAAAIASFAFNKKVPVVDGNVLRVLTRIFGIERDISLPGTVREIEKIAGELIDENSPGIFNQAIMEFGAMFCTPQKPDCPVCIFKSDCIAYKTDLVSKLPVKINKVKVKKRFFHYVLFTNNGFTAMKERKGKDIWNGLFEYYLIEDQGLIDPDDLRIKINSEVSEKIFFKNISDVYIHILTHQKLFVRFYVCDIENKSQLEKLGYNFYSDEEIENLAKPVLILKYINK